MSSAVALPKFKLSESPNTRSIDIFDWTITAVTSPISNASECDALQGTLGFPLPEMTFGNNSLEIKHRPSGWTYSFRTEDALKGVKNGELGDGDGGVKVGYADAWLKSRTDPDSQLPLPTTSPTKPFDWTYTTTYPGNQVRSDGSEEIEWVKEDPTDSQHGIPLAELTRPDPILFYAEIPLYEDELHDNGASHLLVRIRVMPTCIFILSRFTLRVDNVLFRAHDTRLYHSFASSPSVVVRETSGWEAPYDPVKSHLPKKDDLTPLTDPNFIGRVLASIPKEATQVLGAGTNWRGLGTTLEVATLRQP
ncbi:type 2A phosphatase activator TIP41 [Amylostereum chailletii]|nr:type 2A phosphatase activator TIP41 [Amylostereum chailletii]